MATRIDSARLAVRLGVSVRTLRWWRQNSTGPKWGRYGARVEYLLSDVEQWEQQQQGAMLNYYSTPQLAALLELSETTIVMWRWEGKGPKYEKFGRKVRYPKQSTDEWMVKNGYKTERSD